ncbi:hypothetical protein [Microscilla marina]|uniref:Lipoprotein, putative n=1 Tax=Microscilla marina ATCC 23134 TaxID=313606 RepID=A1ZD40_MICM2|nr:hypothetical protein [Microscilla marina]EAY31579.1 lipoprotein, putative [Microscilla marina ATCC 23134]
MKQINYLWLVLALCMLGSCSTAKKNQAKKNMVKLSALQGEVSLKKGQKAYYEASVHGSVGYTVSVLVQNDAVLKFVESNYTYKNPEKSHMSGGDEGIKTYVFEAAKPGQAVLKIIEKFRGDVRNTHRIKIDVKDK